jgi:VanZ family protein
MCPLSGVHRLEPLARTLALLALAAVAWLSLAPPLAPLPGEAAPPLLRALAHLVMHFCLAAMVLAGWNAHAAPAAAFLLAAAVALEAGQTLVPGRAYDPFHLAGNLAGVALGTAFFLALRRFSRTVTA